MDELFTKIDFNVSTLPPIRIFRCENGPGEIPTNLAQLTELLLQVHAANGDLAWVLDTARDLELARNTIS